MMSMMQTYTWELFLTTWNDTQLAQGVDVKHLKQHGATSESNRNEITLSQSIKWQWNTWNDSETPQWMVVELQSATGTHKTM